MAIPKAIKLRLGRIVIATLAVLTIVEYWGATMFASPLLFLAVIALIKAWLIVQYFMHVAQLWHAGEGGH